MANALSGMASASSEIDCFYHFTPDGCRFRSTCPFSHSKISYRDLVNANIQLAKDIAITKKENVDLKNTQKVSDELSRFDSQVIAKMRGMEEELLKVISGLKTRIQELEVALAAFQKATKDAPSSTGANTTPSAPVKN